MQRRFSLIALACVALVGCQTSLAKPDAAMATSASKTHTAHADLLNATLWQQRAAEYDMVTRQSFTLALSQVQRALLDPDWTAAEEQTRPGYQNLPPAVVVDVDETMLDNAPFQARLVQNDDEFTPELWSQWVDEAAAYEVPGAAAYTHALKRMGVTVIYLSNREAVQTQITQENLLRLNFAFADEPKNFTFRDDASGLGSKGARRARVAEQYRIVQLVGDNLGDFSERYKDSKPKRDEIVEQAARMGWLGTRWIALPNAMYGSWEEEAYQYNRKLPYADKNKAKRAALDAKGLPKEQPKP